MFKTIRTIFLLCAIFSAWFLYTEIYKDEAQEVEKLVFTIDQGKSVPEIAKQLSDQQVIRNGWLFKKYVSLKNLDRDINFGTFTVEAPITLKRVVEALAEPTFSEKEITILPGWDLREIAGELKEKGVIEHERELYKITGEPAVQGTKRKSFDHRMLQTLPKGVSLEGYLAPETYRIFTNATAEDVVKKLLDHREAQFTEEMYNDIRKNERTVHEVMTMAGLVEREVQSKKDRAKVSDIFWRRLEAKWGMQADSTVHYLTGKKGDVFTTKEDRASKNPWNTYKYAGLPPGPISSPSISSIMGAIYPSKNKNFYFITTLDGDVKYAEDLEGHNKNVQKYLR
jgi:UPF0755 protein